MVSAIIKEVIEHLCALTECVEQRWIAFAQNSCNAKSEGFRAHLDLN